MRQNRPKALSGGLSENYDPGASNEVSQDPITLIIQCKTPSEANLSEHRRTRYKRHKKQKKATWLAWIIQGGPDIYPPCQVTLTRCSPRKLDDDNLRGALKAIRDSIADLIRPGLAPGRADETDQIQWSYAQEKSPPKQSFVRAEIYKT